MRLYIYLVGPISCGYDEYDSFVVIAESEEEARKVAYEETDDQKNFLVAPVDQLGTANSQQESATPVLGSFNAG
jgi:hypothetical protein